MPSDCVFGLFSIYFMCFCCSCKPGPFLSKHTSPSLTSAVILGTCDNPGNGKMKGSELTSHSSCRQISDLSSCAEGLLELLEIGTLNFMGTETLIISKICNIIIQIIIQTENLLIGIFAFSASPHPTKIKVMEILKIPLMSFIRKSINTPFLYLAVLRLLKIKLYNQFSMHFYFQLSFQALGE